jgi:hypothetical protein
MVNRLLRLPFNFLEAGAGLTLETLETLGMERATFRAALGAGLEELAGRAFVFLSRVFLEVAETVLAREGPGAFPFEAAVAFFSER